MSEISRRDCADELREQAASCRKLARRVMSQRGASALTMVAEQFDTDARRVDPLSLKR